MTPTSWSSRGWGRGLCSRLGFGPGAGRGCRRHLGFGLSTGRGLLHSQGLRFCSASDRATTILNVRSGQAVRRTPDELAPVTERFGLARSAPRQYVDYVSGLLRGDLGTSYQQFRPVRDILAAVVRAPQAAFGWITRVSPA